MDLYTTIISTIQGIIKAAPDILKAYNAVKSFISGIFGAGVITAQQQQLLHDNVDKLFIAMLKGVPPPQWTVEPDPGTTPATPAKV